MLILTAFEEHTAKEQAGESLVLWEENASPFETVRSFRPPRLVSHPPGTLLMSLQHVPWLGRAGR